MADLAPMQQYVPNKTSALMGPPKVTSKPAQPATMATMGKPPKPQSEKDRQAAMRRTFAGLAALGAMMKQQPAR